MCTMISTFRGIRTCLEFKVPSGLRLEWNNEFLTCYTPLNVVYHCPHPFRWAYCCSSLHTMHQRTIVKLTILVGKLSGNLITLWFPVEPLSGSMNQRKPMPQARGWSNSGAPSESAHNRTVDCLKKRVKFTFYYFLSFSLMLWHSLMGLALNWKKMYHLKEPHF